MQQVEWRCLAAPFLQFGTLMTVDPRLCEANSRRTFTASKAFPLMINRRLPWAPFWPYEGRRPRFCFTNLVSPFGGRHHRGGRVNLPSSSYPPGLQCWVWKAFRAPDSSSAVWARRRPSPRTSRTTRCGFPSLQHVLTHLGGGQCPGQAPRVSPLIRLCGGHSG